MTSTVLNRRQTTIETFYDLNDFTSALPELVKHRNSLSLIPILNLRDIKLLEHHFKSEIDLSSIKEDIQGFGHYLACSIYRAGTTNKIINNIRELSSLPSGLLRICGTDRVSTIPDLIQFKLTTHK